MGNGLDLGGASGDATGRTWTLNSLASVPHFGLPGFQLDPIFLPGFINYTSFGTTAFQLAGGSGDDTFDVNATDGLDSGDTTTIRSP